MDEYRSSIELNPLKALASCLDRLRHALTMMNISHEELTIEWWPVVIAAVAWFIVYAFERSVASYWFARALAVLLTPYGLYMCSSLLWRPVPFFDRMMGAVDLRDGEFDVYAFGSFNHEMQTATFLKGEPKSVTRRVRFSWGKGKAAFGQHDIELGLLAKGRLLTMDFWGMATKNIELVIDQEAIEAGSATVLCRRVPAFRYESDEVSLVIALVGTRRGAIEENG